MTVVVNKSTISGEGELGRITWGAAQLGIAQGVLDASPTACSTPARRPTSCSWSRSGSIPRRTTRRR